MNVNGHNLNVEIEGPEAGPAVVLLHHGLGSTRAWRGQMGPLAEAGLRVIAYDRWGYGRSDPRAEFSAPYFEVDRGDLLALLDCLGLERAALVGHSDGGTIALYFAADNPERVSSLVSVAAHVYVEPKMKVGMEGVRREYENDERFREGLRRAHGAKAGRVFDHWFYGWLRPENLEWDLRPCLARIACPALIIQGLEDEHAIPQHATDLAAAIPGAELWLEPGAAHMLPQEKAEAFNRRVLEFLKREA